MRLFISILFAAIGSTLGAAARVGIDTADKAMHGESVGGPVNVSGSVSAALVGGLLGTLLGGPRRAFWFGALLGAAGSERFDAMILERFGIDRDALVAKATEAANRAREAARERASGGEAEAEEAAAG